MDLETTAGAQTATSPLAALRGRLPNLMLRDERRLHRRLEGARKIRTPEALQSFADQISGELDVAERRIARRRDAVPPITYPEELPVSQRRADIRDAIRDNQVVIVAGETGSGKTTQLPKICLELGRGVRGLIGHTQPRRLAARTVAERVAEELAVPLGGAIGWKVRFTDHVGDDTLVKLMTDGILLAEVQQDRTLSQYDTLIIDEAHERSLNVDFLLGYLKQLLPRRPDLKVIITSATIDPERFSRHFRDEHGGDAPIVEVSGRTYPVEVRYRPIVPDTETPDDSADSTEDGERDQTQAICEAVDELRLEGPGDILVFLSGEREIRDTADALGKHLERKHSRVGDSVEILPLFARLSNAEQHRVFQSHSGRRVVLATNVAETSLTVPGIKYVIDPGTARISRYSNRLKVQRLPIEAISQASANQRKGRCGRVSEGICIRLYTEADFLSRPEFTEPEILRTNLASVILQMTAAGLGDIAAFPFLDPPDKRNITDGVQLLEELGALDPTATDVRKRLTESGRKLAQLPVDPRLARMVLEAAANDCAREVMIIAAALSIQDPRERPLEKQQAATEKHSRFVDKESDFSSFLNLWNYLQDKQKELSSNQFRRMCKAEFLNYLRVREWQDIFSQLRQVAKTMGITPNATPGDGLRIHQSLLAGLLSHLGLRDVPASGTATAGPPRRGSTEYLGARSARFAIFPGSVLFKKPPRWVMAAELVETSRLWGRVAAKIEPEWAEKLAPPHLLKHSYSEPHWEKKQGAVMAVEKVTLYGVPIVAARKVNYGRIDPEVSRDLFIRHALVEGDWETYHRFFATNRALLDDVEELEARARRRDILVDDETLFDFYDQRLPADVVSGRHFDSWWKKARHSTPDLLTFDPSLLVNSAAAEVDVQNYPDFWAQDSLRLPLSYQFEPGTQADGVTVDVPLAVLNQVSAVDFTWQIPGLRDELVTALIRSLPKQVRRNFVPAPDFAKAALARMTPDEPLLDALERELYAMTRIAVPRETWGLDKLPAHLTVTFRVVDEADKVVAEGKDLDALKLELKPSMQATLSAAAPDLTQEGLRSWSFGELPQLVESVSGGLGWSGALSVTAYPALVDEGETVAIRMFDTEITQRRSMWRGVRRLLLIGLPAPIKLVHGRLSNQAKLVLTRNPHGSVGVLLDDCAAAAVDRFIAGSGGPPWDAVGFDALAARVKAEVGPVLSEVLGHVERTLAAMHRVESRLAGLGAAAYGPSAADVRRQLAGLVYPGFVTATGVAQLPHLPRYLEAIERRLEKLPENPQRDRDLMLNVEAVQQAYDELVGEVSPDGRVEVGTAVDASLTRIRWMIEELRVSHFAQNLKTAYPVSEKRIYKAMDDVPGV